jgi:hypothetical protein
VEDAAVDANAGDALEGAASDAIDATDATEADAEPDAPVCDYAAPNACSTALVLPDIAGDDGSDTRTTTGITSKWVVVRVLESNIVTSPLSYSATLTVPPGMDFDLFAYEGDVTAANCAATPIAATGAPETVHAMWPDSFGAEDSRVVTFEIRYVSGSSRGPSARWTLAVQGHPG